MKQPVHKTTSGEEDSEPVQHVAVFESSALMSVIWRNVAHDRRQLTHVNALFSMNSPGATFLDKIAKLAEHYDVLFPEVKVVYKVRD